jgi:argininosuccinate lyase
MSEAEFRSTLDPISIVKNRASVGGPQPAEMDRMLKAAKRQLARQGEWINEKRAYINDALTALDRDFTKIIGDK